MKNIPHLHLKPNRAVIESVSHFSLTEAYRIFSLFVQMIRIVLVLVKVTGVKYIVLLTAVGQLSRENWT